MNDHVPRPRISVGRQVRRWRADRGLTLAAVAEQTGLNLGFLSQIENDKASPSLDTLGALGAALDVPPAWFLIDDVPRPRRARRRRAVARVLDAPDLRRARYGDRRPHPSRRGASPGPQRSLADAPGRPRGGARTGRLRGLGRDDPARGRGGRRPAGRDADPQPSDRARPLTT